MEAAGEAPVSRPLTLWATVAAAGIVQLPTAAIVVALGTIHGQFNASMAELQWAFVAFYIPFTAFLIAAGRLSDIFGRRRALLLGTAVFALGSVLAAVAPGVEVLIAGIAIAGAGGLPAPGPGIDSPAEASPSLQCYVTEFTAPAAYGPGLPDSTPPTNKERI